MDFTGLFFCVCSLIIGMALIALVWLLFVWALGKLFGIGIPPQIQNVLVVIVVILMLAGLVDCIVGGNHFALWRH